MENMKHLILNLMQFLPLILLILLPLSSLSFAGPPDSLIKGADGAEMALVPEGEFIMGLDPDEAGSERNPLSRRFLPGFYIDKYEVTNDLYKACVRAGACKEPSLIIDYPKTIHEEGKEWYRDEERGDYPVVGITWHQAAAYCRWAGNRLPTEGEWEKAARGDDKRHYPWGDEWRDDLANWDEGGHRDGYKKIAPVGSFPGGVSPYGVHDMAGNVREWVDNFILKGGSWYSIPDSLRAGDPGHGFLVERDDDMGFRCAMDVARDNE